MIMARRGAWAVLAAAAVLWSCETAPPSTAFPELSYGHLPPIRLDVREVEIVAAYKSPAIPPNVEHLFPVKPIDAAQRWARDRLRAAGAAGVARVVIKQASVVEVPLKRSTGVRGWLTTDQTERYDGVIEVSIDIRDGAGSSRGKVISRAQRSRSVAEDISLHEREAMWFRLTESLMNDLNAALETQIQTHLRALLK